jgi:hypothetical protein
MEAVLALALVLVLAVSRGALTVRGTEDSKSALLMSARIWGGWSGGDALDKGVRSNWVGV